MLWIASTVERDGVSSGDASTIGVAKVDLVLECSTFHDWLVSEFFSFKRKLFHVSNLIVGNDHGVVV